MVSRRVPATRVNTNTPGFEDVLVSVATFSTSSPPPPPPPLPSLPAWSLRHSPGTSRSAGRPQKTPRLRALRRNRCWAGSVGWGRQVRIRLTPVLSCSFAWLGAGLSFRSRGEGGGGGGGTFVMRPLGGNLPLTRKSDVTERKEGERKEQAR